MKSIESHLRKIIREQLLIEELTGGGAVATVYHGSDMPPYSPYSSNDKKGLVDILMKDEFMAGGEGGAGFGPGLYSVTDLNINGLKTQTLQGTYGSYIYKLRVKLDGYLILDAETERLLRGESVGIIEQLKLLGISRGDIQKIQQRMKLYDVNGGDADKKQIFIAKEISKLIAGKIKGLVFVATPMYLDGPMGRTVVTYDPGTVLPLSYTKLKVDEETGDYSTSGWIPVGYKDPQDLKANIQRSATGRWQEERYGSSNVVGELKRISKLPPDKRTFSPRDQGITKNLFLRDIDELYTQRVRSLPEFLHVAGHMSLAGNTTLRELPDGLRVDNDLTLNRSTIESLPDDLVVGGSLHISNTGIAAIPDTIKVGGWIYGFEGDKSKLSGEIFKKVR